MRTNLKVYRVRLGLSQEEMSAILNCKRATYSAIECGNRSGKPSFWKKFQAAFKVPDSDMWALMENE